MILQTFRATTDPSVIRNAAAFFDNSNSTIFRELIQNARRAGATEIRLLSKTAPAGKLVVEDNGQGCEPSDLLRFGGSNWSKAIRSRESPAGLGFFSLASRNPVVSCPARGWAMRLRKEHFTGEADIEVEEILVEEVDGLRIEFDNIGYVDVGAVESLVRYAPLQEVTVDGVPTPTGLDPFEDVIEANSRTRHKRYRDPGTGMEVLLVLSPSLKNSIEAEPRYPWGCDTYTTGTVRSDSAGLILCYGGHVVVMERAFKFRLSDGRGTYSMAVRVKVTDESVLPLELPQRNKVVMTQELEALMHYARCQALRVFVATLSHPSRMGLGFWVTARKHGYDGPVAVSPVLGRIMHRPSGFDVADYSFELESGTGDREDGETCHYHTTKSFEVDDVARYPQAVWAPEGVVARALLMTDFPECPDEYAPGLMLVRPSKGVMEGVTLDELDGIDFAKEHVAALKEMASRDIADAVSFKFCVDGNETHMESGTDFVFDDDNSPTDIPSHLLFDTISLSIYREDGEEPCMSWDIPVAFFTEGENDEPVKLVMTKKWFHGGAGDDIEHIAREMAGAVAARRNLSYVSSEYGDGDDGEELEAEIRKDILLQLAKFTDTSKILRRRLEEALDSAITKIPRDLYPAGELALSVNAVLAPSRDGRYHGPVKLEFSLEPVKAIEQR